VTSGGSSYICILASTGNAVSNATYWTQLAAGGTDVGTTITTQGDILYRDGSGLARLGFGTSGHVLTTKGTGANPVWEAAGGGLTLNTNFFITRWGGAFTTNSTTPVDVTGGVLTLSAQSGTTNWLVHFNEMRQEQGWNSTNGVHMYGTDGSTAGTRLGETHCQYDNVPSAHGNSDQIRSGTYYVGFTDGQTPIFKLQAQKRGSSNGYEINQLATDYSIITATKIT
jgi:hypothetical protein